MTSGRVKSSRLLKVGEESGEATNALLGSEIQLLFEAEGRIAADGWSREGKETLSDGTTTEAT